MIALRLLLVFIFVGLSVAGFGKIDGAELRAVIVMFNIGDMSPLSSWPNDKYFGNSTLWEDGYGQLNNFGKQRHYSLGKWFRNRYNGFLPARYNRSDIYVRSTDVDRALMSAESNLAGLYPPSGDQIWNSNISWQPAAIHTVPMNEDHLLINRIPCAKHDRLRQNVLNSKEFIKFFKERAELFQNISTLTGYSTDEITLDVFSQLFYQITIYKKYNLTLPSWTEQYWSPIKFLSAKSFTINTYTEEMSRLRVGKFFNFLLNYFNSIRNQTNLSSIQENKLTGTEDTGVRKFLMMSGHYSTITDRTNALGVFPGVSPEFASTVIWEVKSKNGSNDDLYINMFYKNSTHFSPLVIPGCYFNCDIDDFVKLVKPKSITVAQWTQECAKK